MFLTPAFILAVIGVVCLLWASLPTICKQPAAVSLHPLGTALCFAALLLVGK